MNDDLELMEFSSCPKCGFENNEDAETCGKCGIVFSKYDPSKDPDTRASRSPSAESETANANQPTHTPRPSSTSSSSDTFSDGAFANLPWVKIVVVLLVVGAAGYWWTSSSYEVIGAELGKGNPTVILMHGHGAQGDDMVPVAELLAEDVPNATIIVPPGAHSKMLGRSWMNGGTRKEMNEQLQASRKVILDAVEDAEAAGVAPEDIYIGGFSQGGQMALEFVGGESVDRQFAGVIIMSGGWPNWPSEVPPFGGANLSRDARAFMTHGKGDNIFPVRQAKDIADQLRGVGVETELVVFSGGHNVDLELIDKTGTFLKAH